MENIFAIRYPDLAEKLRHPDENTLAARFPELAAQWHPTKNGDLTPDKVPPGMDEDVWWQCENGHEWQAPVYRRSGRKDGCPYCSGRYAIPGETDLATTHPELAAQWHPTRNRELTPQTVKAGTPKKVWWICDKGHEWQAPVSRRSSGGSCPVCADKVRGQKRATPAPGQSFGDVAEPILLSEWHEDNNFSPFSIKPRSGKRVKWKCSVCENEWEASIANRTSGRGCPVCARKKSWDTRRKNNVKEQKNEAEQ